MWISVILIKINFGVQAITNNNIIYDVPTPMFLSHYLLIIKGPFGWRSEKVGGWKISERVEKWEDRKDLVFPHTCLVEGVEKWEGEFFFFCLVGKKNVRMENVIYINWLLCHWESERG